MRTVLLLVICTLLISGCARTKFGRASLANKAKVELIGKTKKEILLCAGVPNRSEKADNIEFLTYVSGGDSRGSIRSSRNSSSRRSSVSVKKRYCEVTFIFDSGIVEKVNYSGRTGGLATRGEQCAFVLQNCVSN